MFGSSKKEDDSKKNTVAAPSAGGALNALVKGCEMEGNLNCDTDLRVDGSLKGKINSKAKVIIGPGGRIDGEINCQNAVIEGYFRGKMTVSEILNVREEADVMGEIFTQKLVVQSGAKFNVACKMSNNPIKSNANGTAKPIAEKSN